MSLRQNSENPDLRRRRSAGAGLSALAFMCVVLLLLIHEPNRSALRAAPSSSARAFELATSWPLPASEPLDAPTDVALLPDGRMYISEGRRGIVHEIAAGGVANPEWDVTTIPGRFGLCADEYWRAWAIAGDSGSPDGKRKSAAVAAWTCQFAGPGVARYRTVYEARTPDRPMSERAILSERVSITADDIAVATDTGHYYISQPTVYHDEDQQPAHGGLVYRIVPWNGAYFGNPIDVGRRRSSDRVRIATLSGGRVAVAQPLSNTIAVYSASGTSELVIDIEDGYEPLDISALPDGHIFALMRPPRTDPTLPLVMEWRPDGSIGRRWSAQALGTCHPPMGTWPWSMDVSEAGFALVAGCDRFEVLRFDWEANRRWAGAGGWIATEDPGRGLLSELQRAPSMDMDHSDHGTWVLDHAAQSVYELDSSGRTTQVRRAPRNARDLAVDEWGRAVVSTTDDELWRSGPETFWQSVRPSDYPGGHGVDGGRVSVAGGRLWVTRPAVKSVAVIDLNASSVDSAAFVSAANGHWPADVAAGGQDHWYSADFDASQIARWSGGIKTNAWRSGLLEGPTRLDHSPTPAFAYWLAVLTADAWVEVYQAENGLLAGRFQPRRSDGSIIEASDLAVDAQGRVLVVDPNDRRVFVFAPRDIPNPSGTPPTPTPTTGQDCQVQGDKVVGPQRIVLGQSAAITLSFAAECPGRTDFIGADVILVLQHDLGAEEVEAAKLIATSIVNNADGEHHRIGIVEFLSYVKIGHDLSANRDSLLTGIDAFRYFTTQARPIGIDLAGAIEMAETMLRRDGRANAQPVVVLMADGHYGYNGVGREPYPIAESLRNRGVIIYSIGIGHDFWEDRLIRIAGGRSRHIHAATGDQVRLSFRTILREIQSGMTGKVVIEDVMAREVTVVSGSASPPAIEQSDRLLWGFGALPRTGVTLTYRILANAPGRWPTNRMAWAEFSDACGSPQRFEFPVPVIEVVTPTPSPTPTPTPTATRVPKPVYLPILLWNLPCAPETQSADYVLVTDTSTSMSEVTSPGGPTKMEAARAAARAFLGQLKPGRDQAALIQFNGTATVVEPLTDDPARVVAALDRLTQAQGTRIDLGLDAALAELSGPDRRPDNSPVVILLTDGAPSAGATPETVRAAAARAQAAGLLVFTIGLGADVDGDLLRDVATRPEWYYPAPDTADLAAIYARIAVEIPCRPDWP